MDDRKPVRYLAPIALVVLAFGVYLIVHDNTKSQPSPKQAQHQRSPRGNGKYANQKYYIVQPGDILSRIAQKTGIPVTTIETLNPDIAPNNVRAGQKIVLHR